MRTVLVVDQEYPFPSLPQKLQACQEDKGARKVRLEEVAPQMVHHRGDKTEG